MEQRVKGGWESWRGRLGPRARYRGWLHLGSAFLQDSVSPSGKRPVERPLPAHGAAGGRGGGSGPRSLCSAPAIPERGAGAGQGQPRLGPAPRQPAGS